MSKDFQELYKSNISMKDSQKERRRSLLDKQKQERQNAQDQQRPLDDIFEKVLKSNEGKTNWHKRQQKRMKQSFQEIYGVELSLQQSEWLRERPEDLSDWLLVPCPRGQHSLVVAFNKRTAVYNRIGQCISVFRSMLPGDGIENNDLTILDCIYVREEDTFYVLDVLAFGGQQNLIYCEAEFRFFWLRSKWDELEHLEQRSGHNQKPFHLVKQYDFENTPQITECLQKFPLWEHNKPQLDGFLFYHRFASYTCGSTPLVGWLFPFMVPDILGLNVNEHYTKPKDYEEPLKYMHFFDERLKMKRERKQERKERWQQKMKEENEIAHTEKETNKIENDNGFPELMDNACTTEDDEDDDSLKKVLDAARALEMEQDNDEFDENIAHDSITAAFN